jgi:uncharacterized protein (DUF2249 family)
MLPPEPFERVVDALATLREGETVLLVLEREPLPLYEFLNNNRYEWSAASEPDGHIVVRIREPESR